MNLKARTRQLLFRILRRDPEAVVVSFLSGEDPLAHAMLEEIRGLEPARRHYAVWIGRPRDMSGVTGVALAPGSAWQLYRQLRRVFRPLRIGLAPVLFTPEASFGALRLAAFLLAPSKILAYNMKLERHHLRLRTAGASWLFLHGVPLDRISLRPGWLCPWKRGRSEQPRTYRLLDGRPFSPGRLRVAILSPYFPYPLSHGGAVRIFHLLRETARKFDLVLFAFTEGSQPEEHGPVLEFCSKVVLVPTPRYREPRWSSLQPPEVCEYRCDMMRELWRGLCGEYGVALRQIEYTHLAPYGGDVLVEHDVTFDLYRQIYERQRTLSAWWNWWRWRRFEMRAVRGFRRAFVMSQKDAALLDTPRATVLGNGVDLERFQPDQEWPGQRLLFIGSFRHFPNVVAYRFFTGEVWPRLRARFPDITLTAVAGPDPLLYWRAAANSLEPPRDERIQLLEFVRDVRPLYVEANVVIVPTLVSAGTNLKVLEAMAMERAVVSTTSGCAGLGLEHGASVWIADDAAAFAEGVGRLLGDAELRRSMAAAARRIAEDRFDWRRLGAFQCAILGELTLPPLVIRKARANDIPELDRIQKASPEAVLWEPWSYLSYDCRVVEVGGRVAGFVVCRPLGPGESEVLSLVVDPELRRRGLASRLMCAVMDGSPGTWFLEVRESNWPARNLYEKFGFREVARRPNYYQDTSETAVVMRR